MSATPNDPRPGDFDADLARVQPGDVHVAEADAQREVVRQVTVRGEAADLLERLARRRGEEPNAVVADLIRAASDDAR